MSRKSACVPKAWEDEIDRVLDGYRTETYALDEKRWATLDSGQPKHHSWAEAICNTVVGYALALVGQLFIYPALNIHVTLGQNMFIGAVFTLLSLVRSYTLRRVFNWWHLHVRPR